MFAPAELPDTFDKYDEPRLHMKALMNTVLVDFDLSLRILIPLESAGIRTLGDLLSRPKIEIAAIPMIGVASIQKIENCLSRYNLSLKK